MSMRILRNSSANLRGMLWMVLATLLLTSMHGMIRYLSADLPPFVIAFWRNLFGLLVFLPWVLRRGLVIFETRRLGLHALRAVIMTVNMMAAFTAISLIPLAQVAALQMTLPLVLTLGAILFLGEKARVRRWTALSIGFIGALIIIRPGFQAVSLGVLLMLAVVVLGGTGRLMAKYLTRDDAPVTIGAYMNVLMTPLSLLVALFVWQWPTGSEFAGLVVLGLFGTGAQLAIVQAYRAADMGVVEPVTFLRLVWAALIGGVFFGGWPDLWTWAGGVVIFVSTTYIAHRESRLKNAQAAVT